MRFHLNKTVVLAGILLGVLHLVAVSTVALNLLLSEVDAQWQLVWVVFLLLDFPISLLVVFQGSIFPEFAFHALPYPASDFRGFWLPIVVHGVLGSLWWGLLPLAINAAVIGLKQLRQTGSRRDK